LKTNFNSWQIYGNKHGETKAAGISPFTEKSMVVEVVKDFLSCQ
jgi:hypothetical protein